MQRTCLCDVKNINWCDVNCYDSITVRLSGHLTLVSKTKKCATNKKIFDDNSKQLEKKTVQIITQHRKYTKNRSFEQRVLLATLLGSFIST